MIRQSHIIAFDGTHASGKTTLIYAVAASLRAQGIHCAVLPEPARKSSLVDDVVLRGVGDFDVPLEIDLIAAHVSQCINAARTHPVVLADKTPLNVLAYTELLVTPRDDVERDLLSSAEEFSRSWTRVYDLVFYCQDHFSPNQPGDEMRAKVVDIQSEVDRAVVRQYREADAPLYRIPPGLDLSARTLFATMRIKEVLSNHD